MYIYIYVCICIRICIYIYIHIYIYIYDVQGVQRSSPVGPSVFSGPFGIQPPPSGIQQIGSGCPSGMKGGGAHLQIERSVHAARYTRELQIHGRVQVLVHIYIGICIYYSDLRVQPTTRGIQIHGRVQILYIYIYIHTYIHMYRYIYIYIYIIYICTHT